MSEPSGPSRRFRGFSPPTVALLAVGVIAALGWALLSQPHGAPPSRYSLKVDLNRATSAELAAIPGIGPSLADRIVSDREAHGPFRSIDDVDRVPGIGESLTDQIDDWATVEHR